MVAPKIGDAQCTPGTAGQSVWSSVTASDTAEIDYEVSVPDGDHKVTVTATALGDVYLTQSGSDWTIDADKKTATTVIQLTSKDCATTALVAPTIGDAQCTPGTAGQTVWSSVTASDTAEIDYEVSVPDGDHKVTVTATALGDVYLTQSGSDWTIDANKKTATIEIQLTSKDCATTDLATPQVDAAQCSPGDSGTVWGSVTAPTDTAEIDYEVTTDTATHIATVTASITAGHDDLYLTHSGTEWKIDADKKTATIDIKLGSTTCSTPTTTPNNPEPLLARPSVGNQCLLVGDARAVTVTTTTVNGIDYTVTGNGTTTVTVTAKARSGFDLSVPAGWTDNHDGTATIVLTPNSDGVVCVGGESSTVTTPPSKTAAMLLPSNTADIEVLPASATVSGDIAYTGVDTLKYAALALLLLLGGSALLVFAKMRRAPRAH
jgi:hypothetical protein